MVRTQPTVVHQQYYCLRQDHFDIVLFYFCRQLSQTEQTKRADTGKENPPAMNIQTSIGTGPFSLSAFSFHMH